MRHRHKGMTYAKAGVSLAKGDRLVRSIAPLARKTQRKEVLSAVGGFAALSRLPKSYQRPVIVLSTDGVGTKILLAKELRKLNTVGIDLVAMCANDILTLGAEPFAFLDYFATGKLNLQQGKELIQGIAKGCKQAGCALMGGETAEMPSVYKRGDFDLAGFCVGIVDETKIIEGGKVRPGDEIIGLSSNGLHSNGYSLVRAILRRQKLSLRSRCPWFKGRTLGQELLRPTRIYVKSLQKSIHAQIPKAMAHITGGGLEGNLPRVLPRGVCAKVWKNSWRVPSIFHFLQQCGDVSDHEMYRVFNMGIGFVVIVSPKHASRVIKTIPHARKIGVVEKTKGNSFVSWKG